MGTMCKHGKMHTKPFVSIRVSINGYVTENKDRYLKEILF
jgi:hypothetical protein